MTAPLQKSGLFMTLLLILSNLIGLAVFHKCWQLNSTGRCIEVALFISKTLNYSLKWFEGAWFFLLWLRLEPYSLVEQKQTILKIYVTSFLYSNCIHAIAEWFQPCKKRSRPNKVNSHCTDRRRQTATNTCFVWLMYYPCQHLGICWCFFCQLKMLN